MVSGTRVVDDDSSVVLGKVSNILIDPDTGKVLGFFISTGGFLHPHQLFLSGIDIIAWGMVIHVRSADMLSEPEEIVRLQPLLAGERTILHQDIVTEKEKTNLGTCTDVQFDTLKLSVEWLFPRKFLVAGLPIPTSGIVEVTKDAIVVKEPLVTQTEKELTESGVTLQQEVLPA